jgi:hypothetical protein
MGPFLMVLTLPGMTLRALIFIWECERLSV